MNIHLPAIWGSPGVQGFDPHPYGTFNMQKPRRFGFGCD